MKTGEGEMRGRKMAGVITEFHINRNDFGVGKPGGIGDDVRLIVSLEGVKS